MASSLRGQVEDPLSLKQLSLSTTPADPSNGRRYSNRSLGDSGADLVCNISTSSYPLTINWCIKWQGSLTMAGRLVQDLQQRE